MALLCLKGKKKEMRAMGKIISGESGQDAVI